MHILILCMDLIKLKSSIKVVINVEYAIFSVIRAYRDPFCFCFFVLLLLDLVVNNHTNMADEVENTRPNTYIMRGEIQLVHSKTQRLENNFMKGKKKTLHIQN